MTAFIDCTSLNINYDVMGLATVSYTVVSNDAGFHTFNTITAGGQTFTGYVVNASLNKIPNTSWFETQVTIITTTD